VEQEALSVRQRTEKMEDLGYLLQPKPAVEVLDYAVAFAGRVFKGFAVADSNSAANVLDQF
jgi:hypothetical protein